MSAYTPGPWSIPDDQWDDDSPVDLKCCIRISDRSEHLDVAYVSGYGYSGVPEANARLIAAAPELYEALRDLLSAEKLDDGDPILDRARGKAAAALAKVTS